MENKSYQKGTAAVWAGEGNVSVKGAATTPIVNAVAFSYTDLDEWHEASLGKSPGYIYSRNTNPTVAALEEKIRVLEEAEMATSFSTGMAAISNTLFTFLTAGKRVVSQKDTYGGTSKIFLDFLPHYNVRVQLCDTGDHEQMEAEIARGCDMVYLETPTNPTLKIVDIGRLAKAARAAGAIVVVDNTFATPINQNPLLLGAHLVVHSATKFLSGHSDAMGGLLAGEQELVQKVFHFREINGASLQADPAYMIARGMKTLELRIERQNASALVLAPLVTKASYNKRSVLPRAGEPPQPCHCQKPDARLRRHPQLFAGSRLRCREKIPAPAQTGAPGCQPGLSKYARRAAAYHQPCGAYRGTAPPAGYPGRTDSLLGWHRKRN